MEGILEGLILMYATYYNKDLDSLKEKLNDYKYLNVNSDQLVEELIHLNYEIHKIVLKHKYGEDICEDVDVNLTEIEFLPNICNSEYIVLPKEYESNHCEIIDIQQYVK